MHPLPGRWLSRVGPRSVRARAAVAAGLAGAILFVAGGLWMRHVVYESRLQRSQAELEDMMRTSSILAADCSSTECEWSLTKTFLKPDGSPSVLRWDYLVAYSYEAVSANNTILTSTADLHPFEQGRPLFPSDPTSAKVAAQWPAGEWEDPIRHGSVDLGAASPKSRGTLADRPHRVVAMQMRAANLAESPLPRPHSGPDKGNLLNPPPRSTPLGSPVWVYVLVPMAPAEAAVATVDRILLPGLPAAILLLAFVAWLATDRALRPVEQMRNEAVEITSADLDRRLQVPDSADHLASLAVAFNDTLDRLAAAVQRQRRFVADAAHEIRSPISNLRTTLEVALSHSASRDPQAVVAAATAAVEQTRRLHRLADDLLLLSRLEAGQLTRTQPVDLVVLVRDQLADRGRIGPVMFSFDPGPDPAPRIDGNPVELSRLLTNMLDNAERHARSAVRVSLGAGPAGEAVLVMADDGSGIPEADRERVFDRFFRLDEARSRDAGGAGLGLAIARDVCVRHGGTLTVTEAISGGAQFVARLSAPEVNRGDVVAEGVRELTSD
jgi:signal transduction histidine kinase